MSKKQPKKRREPKFRHHKASGQGFVEVKGRRIYLGRFDLPETLAKYHRFVAELLSGGGLPQVEANEITVVEIIARFWEHAQVYYRKPNGTPTSEVENIRLALRPVRDLYGHTTANDFGPRALKAVRQHMVAKGNCRTYVNRHVGRVKRMFKWAVAEELIAPSVHQALQAVPGLKLGRSDAREHEPVRPVPEAHVTAIQSDVSRQIWALVQLQLHTAARAGELVVMRPIDLDTSGPIWLYQPSDHKTTHRGHDRTIYLGPRAQEIVHPFLAGRPVNAYMFSPAEADAERRARLHEQRKTPMTCGNKPGSHRQAQPKRRPGPCYTVGSYRRAIERACHLANVPLWTPHRLRHSAGTHVRKEFGVEAAQLMLGHARADVTQVYAERNHARALEVAAKIG